MGPESAKVVQIAGFRGFWIYPFLTKIPFAGSEGVGAGQNFRGKKLDILRYIPEKKSLKNSKNSRSYKNLLLALFFSGHGRSPSVVITDC